MIVLVGVGHVFRISDKIKEMIIAFSPEVVAVELDAYRYNILVEKKRMAIKGESYQYATDISTPILFRLLARIQEGIARNYNVVAGEEMLSAIDGANIVGAKVALIDIDIRSLAQRFKDPSTMLERVKIIAFIVIGALMSLFRIRRSKGGRKNLEDEIMDFERDPEKYIRELETQFPVLKHELIDVRDKYMSKNIITLGKKYNKIMAFVGAGHINGMVRILQESGIEKSEIRIIRLTDLISGDEERYSNILSDLRRLGRVTEPSNVMTLVAEGDSHSVGIRFEIKGCEE